MKVQTKLISLLLLLSVIFVAGGFLYQFFENNKLNIAIKGDIKEKNIYLDKIMELKGENIVALAIDYTRWDEMVNFIRNNDREWAKEMINDVVLDTYQVDAIWIYKTDLSLAYSVNRPDVVGMKEFPSSKESINNIFLKERIRHFFMNTEAGLMEICAATIHPTTDAARETVPQGYFLVGRLWKERYIDELEKLLEGDIEIGAVKERAPNSQNALGRDSIILSKELVDWEGKPVITMYITIKSPEISNQRLLSRNMMLMFIGFLAFIIIFIAIFLTTAVNMPLSMISQILRGDKPKGIKNLENKSDEFGDISRLIAKFFNQKEDLVQEIAERKKAEEELKKAYTELETTQNQLIQAEKLNAVGQLASGVAHEVRNPLGIILQGINYLEKKFSDKESDVSEILAMIKDNIKRSDQIINSLLDFSKATRLVLQPEDINSVLDNSLSLVKNHIEGKNISVVKEMEENIPRVLADKNKIEQVFINILLNAIQAMPGGGKIIIHSYEKKLSEARNGIGRRREDSFRPGEKAVVIQIEDTGCGISQENINKIFDPFFTTKGPTGGAGLGLSVSRNIIHMHKGLIFAESNPEGGTKVSVVLKIRNK
ncbi:MAG: CHASE4 domain-containing protein [Candidatus Omnitrophica bacterium]|nr:CHASE4 domain-containing protein [Candidatus Omnitrophota bacterium]MDD5355353.1 CHASE4 domain-containing protein [Candidatus Omnitrophota bacterium]